MQIIIKSKGGKKYLAAYQSIRNKDKVKKVFIKYLGVAEYIEEGKEKDYLFRYLKSKKEGSKITCKNFNGDKLVLCYPKRLDKKYAGYKKEKEITEDYIILSKHPKEFIFFEKLRVHKNRIVNTSTENRLVKKWTGL